jgi:hypothetical protein
MGALAAGFVPTSLTSALLKLLLIGDILLNNTALLYWQFWVAQLIDFLTF